MHQALHPTRTALLVLALIVQVGAVVVGACVGADCAMQPQPAGSIAAVCCCDSACAGLVADETAALPSEVSVSTPGFIGQAPSYTLSAARAPLAVTSPHEVARPRLHLFQLNQSYRL